MNILALKKVTPLTIESPSEASKLNKDVFYKTLTTRNRHFVSDEAQESLKNLKVFIAGCGSGGGACIEPLIRLGVTHMRIADNGAYELANLNRQHAFVDSIGVNKAEFHYGEVKRINPFTDIEYFNQGITHENLPQLIEWADIVIDCVDVTTYAAIDLKISLHEHSKKNRKPVFSMLDLGYCQWGTGFDYRKDHVDVLNGRRDRARKARHPIKVMFEMFPLEVVPAHSMQLMIDLLEDVKQPASQLGCASDMLSSVIAPSILRYAEYREVVKGWNINLEYLAQPFSKRLKTYLQYPFMWWKAKSLLNQLE
jgi:hypothetical protein